MKNVIAKNKKEIEKYREKIFKAKEECRKKFAKFPYRKKLKILDEMAKFVEIIKKSKYYGRKNAKI